MLRFLGVLEPALANASLPADVDKLMLGTHPDLVEYLWNLPADGQESCACVINGRSRPLLVHARSGIIYGLAGGTSTLALRLPEPELSVARAVPGFGREYRYPAGLVRAASIGDDWALVRPFSDVNVEWCRRALAYAGTLH